MKTTAIALICSSLIFLSGAVAVAQLQGEVRHTPTVADFPVQPGDPAPDTAWCSFSADYDHVYCQALVNEQKVYFSRNVRDGTVRTISYPTGRMAVGELVALWGRPTAVADSGIFRRVYWGTKSALVLAKRFTPNSVAAFVTLGLMVDNVGEWRGFTTR